MKKAASLVSLLSRPASSAITDGALHRVFGLRLPPPGHMASRNRARSSPSQKYPPSRSSASTIAS